VVLELLIKRLKEELRKEYGYGNYQDKNLPKNKEINKYKPTTIYKKRSSTNIRNRKVLKRIKRRSWSMMLKRIVMLIVLGLFLAISALSFSAERILSYEETFLDKETGIVYAIGEKIPYTGVVKNYKFLGRDSILEGRIIFKNGLMEGTFEFLYPSGKTASVATYKNGKKEGEQKDFYENGVVRLEILYKNDKMNGIGKKYSTKGILRGEFPYKDDELNGVVKQYNEVTGKLEIEADYKNGKTEGSVKKYYPNGKLESEQRYKNDLREGLTKLYYEDGSLKAEKFYKNGKLQGINRIYYPNGKLQTEANFKDDMLDGNFKEYDETGKLIEQGTYKDDVRIK